MAKKEISRPQTAGIPPFGLRLQPELKKRVEDAAVNSGRSMNAEIAARLQQSFETDGLVDQLRMAEYKLEQLTRSDPAAGDVRLSPALRAIVDRTAREAGVSLGDALATLALAGYAKGSPAVVYFAADPSQTAGGYMDVFKAVADHIAPDTKIFIEHSGTRVHVRASDTDAEDATDH